MHGSREPITCRHPAVYRTHVGETMADTSCSGRDPSGCRCLILFIQASLLLSLIDIVAGHAPPRWNRRTVEAYQGGDLTLVCTVSGLKLLDAVRISKKEHGHHPAATWIAIADNDNVKYPFSRLSRYRIAYTINHGTATTTLYFNGIRGEDAGLIGCHSLTDEQNIAVVNLTVRVPIQSVSIVAIRNTNEKLTTGLDDDDDGYGNMSVITLRERMETGVACIANITGSLTPPIVRIRIDGFDRTDLFTISEESRIIGSDSNDGNGLYYGEMKLSYVNRKPNPEFHRKTITCTAIRKDGNFTDVKTTSARLHVFYAPVINCSSFEIYAKTGDGVKIECIIKSDLPTSSTSFTYEDADDRSRRNVASDGRIQLIERRNSSSLIEITAIIKSVTSAYFSTFRLAARNDIGENERLIYVVDRERPLQHAGLQEKRQRELQALRSGEAKSQSTVPLIVTLLVCWSSVFFHCV